MFGKRFWWRELPAFVIGTGMMALAVNMVYSPMGMVPGGFSGLAILLSHMLYEYAGFPMAVWSINLLLNVPVFVWGIFEKGHRFNHEIIHCQPHIFGNVVCDTGAAGGRGRFCDGCYCWWCTDRRRYWSGICNRIFYRWNRSAWGA